MFCQEKYARWCTLECDYHLPISLHTEDRLTGLKSRPPAFYLKQNTRLTRAFQTIKS